MTLVLAVGVFVGFTLLSLVFPIAAEIGRGQDFSQGKELDNLIKGFLDIEVVKATTWFLRGFLNVQVLIPFRNFMLSIPTPALILLVAAFALALAGRKQAIYALVFFSLVALSGQGNHYALFRHFSGFAGSANWAANWDHRRAV